jgi:hypothetical protein
MCCNLMSKNSSFSRYPPFCIFIKFLITLSLLNVGPINFKLGIHMYTIKTEISTKFILCTISKWRTF